MESELQTPPASEAASSGQTASTASAPEPASGGPASWEAAFSAEPTSGASNSDHVPACRVDSEPSATPAASNDAAPAAEGAPAARGQEPPKDGEPTPEEQPGQREPQPGSRRSAAAELTDLREQIKATMAELEAERTAQAEREAAEAQAKADAESAVEELLGKPGEMAALLQKRALAQRSGNWADFTQEDEDRLTRLTEGALLYQPFRDRAMRDADAAIAPKVQEAQGQTQALLQTWAQQFEQAASLGLPALDADTLRKAPDIPSLVKTAHAAGAASRDGEIAELQGKLTDAQARAFTSQPHLATGGVSGSGRTERGYDPTRSPASNLENAFAEEAVVSSNGRR